MLSAYFRTFPDGVFLTASSSAISLRFNTELIKKLLRILWNESGLYFTETFCLFTFEPQFQVSETQTIH